MISDKIAPFHIAVSDSFAISWCRFTAMVLIPRIRMATLEKFAKLTIKLIRVRSSNLS